MKFLWRITLIFLGLIAGCIPEEGAPRPGSIAVRILPQSEEICYFDAANAELEKLVLFRRHHKRLYRLLERDYVTMPFRDSKPIHCILVAIDRYRKEPLHFCRRDMQDLRQYFRDHFEDYNQQLEIKELYDEQATQARVIAMLDAQLKKSHKLSTVIFAFSGHGTEKGLRLHDRILDSAVLRHYFQKSRSRRVIWLIDSCNSGIVALNEPHIHRKSKLYKRSPSLFPSASRFQFMHCFMGQGKVLLCSSRPGEESKDGVFTRALVRHLNTLEDNADFPKLIEGINSGLQHYNRRCHPENRLPMSPFAIVYGDIRIAVTHYLK